MACRQCLWHMRWWPVCKVPGQKLCACCMDSSAWKVPLNTGYRCSLPVRRAEPQRCMGSGRQLAVLPRPVLQHYTLHEVWALPKVSHLALKGRLLAAFSMPSQNVTPCRQQQCSNFANSGSPSTAQVRLTDA